jgi:hypothetical protein
VEKYDVARQVTDDNITRRMRMGCWIIKATSTHSEYAIITAFHCNSGTLPRLNFASIRTLNVLFKMIRNEQELLHSVSFTWNLTMMFRVVLLAVMFQLFTVLIEFMLYGV